MVELVHSRDVLLYIKSEEVIRLVLPSDAHDAALAALRDGGYYTYYGLAAHSASSGLSETAFKAGHFENRPVMGQEIPESEDEAIRRAGMAVVAHGRRMHVVDVGKESAPRRIIEEHLHHLKRFPVLCRPDGRRLEGADQFTQENLEQILRD